LQAELSNTEECSSAAKIAQCRTLTRTTTIYGGALIKRTDPNGLVMEWKLDGFGRLALEKRPDGTETVVTLSRAKDGGGA
jgi:YD repeat-containing protein